MRTALALLVVATVLAATLVVPTAAAACLPGNGIPSQGEFCADPQPGGRSTWSAVGNNDNAATGTSTWEVRGSADGGGASAGGKIWNRKVGLVEPFVLVKTGTAGTDVDVRTFTPRSTHAFVHLDGARSRACVSTDAGSPFPC